MQRLRIVFVLTAAGVCLASLLARAPLIDPDEGLHAAIAQEMLLRHDYVTPTFLGEPFLDKPILFFWAEAASLGMFGMNETAVRVPPLLFGFLGACAVALLGAAMFDADAGYASGIVYSTMVLPVGVSEVAVHDVALIPFLVCACYGIWRLWKNGNLIAWSAVVGISIGLSILTKGLAGAAFAGIYGAVLVAFDRRTLPRLLAAGLLSAAVAAAVAAPWYVAMERAHPGYLHYYFVERHVQGYLTSTQRHAGRQWWYYVPIVAGGALPWLPIVFSRQTAPTVAARRIVWIWFAAGLVFLSAGESKLATYVLPVFPALALAIGERVTSRAAQPRATYVGFVIACALLPFSAATVVAWRYSIDVVTVELSAAIAAGMIAVLAAVSRKRSNQHRLPAMAAMAVVGFSMVLLVALPRAAHWMTAKDLAAILNQRTALPPRVFMLDERIGSVIFYLSPRLRAEAAPGRFEDASLADVFGRLRSEPGDALLAVRADQLPRLQSLVRTPLAADAQFGVYSVFRLDAFRR